MSVPRHRRSFLIALLAVATTGLVAGCGVKGPLYLPEEKEDDEKKDEEKTSRRRTAPPASRIV